MAENPTEMILEQYRREIEDDKEQHQAVLAQMQESMPEHQKFLSMIEDRNAGPPADRRDGPEHRRRSRSWPSRRRTR